MSSFDNLFDNFNKYLVPVVLTVLGLAIVIFGVTPDEKTNEVQNMVFMMAGIAILGGGIISILYVMDIINKPINMALTFGLLPISVAVFGYFNYDSIKQEVAFREKKEVWRTEIKQRLTDIRDAQVEFRLRYNVYAKNLEVLKEFVKTDSAMNIHKEGMVPDKIKPEWIDSLRKWDPVKYKDDPEKLTEAEAWRLGIIVRDTSYEKVIDKIFLNEKKSAKRISRYPFDPDSMDIAPFSGGKKKIEFAIGKVNKNNVDIPVFEAKWYLPHSRLNDTKMDTLRVGSLTEPTTNGNWDE